MDYVVPSGTRIGHVHLKVSDLDKALSFYKDLLGFKIMARYGTQAVFIAADGYHHHIGLNTWYSKNAKPAPVNSAGLFHTAILYPTRKWPPARCCSTTGSGPGRDPDCPSRQKESHHPGKLARPLAYECRHPTSPVPLA